MSSSASGAVVISPAALSAALTALGASAPANLAAAKTALVAAQKATTAGPDADRQPDHGRRCLGCRADAQEHAQRRLGQCDHPRQRRRRPGRRPRAGRLLRRPAAWRRLAADRDRRPGDRRHRAEDLASRSRTTTGASRPATSRWSSSRAARRSRRRRPRSRTTRPRSRSPVLAAGTYDYTLSYAGRRPDRSPSPRPGSLTVAPAAGRGSADRRRPWSSRRPAPTPPTRSR